MKRQGQQYHPELAQDLAGYIVEATKARPQEEDAVGDRADDAAGQHGQHQAARLQRRIDREDPASSDRRKAVAEAMSSCVRGATVRPTGGTCHDGGKRDAAAKPSLHEVAQDQCARPIISTPDGAISGLPSGRALGHTGTRHGPLRHARRCRHVRSSSWRADARHEAEKVGEPFSSLARLGEFMPALPSRSAACLEPRGSPGGGTSGWVGGVLADTIQETFMQPLARRSILRRYRGALPAVLCHRRLGGRCVAGLRFVGYARAAQRRLRDRRAGQFSRSPSRRTRTSAACLAHGGRSAPRPPSS